MMISDLPTDLLEEILCRVPATTLCRLRSTCGRWNSLVKDQRFTEKQFRKAPKQFQVLMLKEHRICPMSVNLRVAPPSIVVKGAVGLHCNLEQVDITQVLHCGGLLLCFTNHNRLVVWNPCLGETRWIQHKTKSYHSYKILRCREDYQLNNTSEIYEFSSDSWTVRDDLALDCRLILPNQVSSQGNTFWLAVDRVFKNRKFVLGFDFTTETFKRFSLPLEKPAYIMSLSVVREEQLSVLSMQCVVSNKMQVWVSDKIDNEAVVLSWSKSFKVDFQAIDCPWISSMVYTFGQEFDCYTETPYVESIKLDFPPFIFSYVPSLVHIQQD
ncbi:hypothetical protein Bca4012_017744 [Brassica carinata]